MTTRKQEPWNCPHCGKSDQDVFSRRRLRLEKMPSRTVRRKNTKTGDRTLPRVKLAELVRQEREEHKETCPENPEN